MGPCVRRGQEGCPPYADVCLTPTDRFTIAYEDRFHGVMEVPFSSFSPSEREKTTGIPWHRVLYFKSGSGVIVWDKEKRIDTIFGDSSGRDSNDRTDLERDDSSRLSKKEKKKLARQRKREKEATQLDVEDREFQRAQFEAYVAGTRGQLPLKEWTSVPYYTFDFEAEAWIPCRDGIGVEQLPRLLECSEDASMICVVTINALSLRTFPGDDPPARAIALFGLLHDSGADVVALQEVTEQTLLLLLAQEWVRKGFYVSDCGDGRTLSEQGGQVLLSRFPLFDLKVYRHSTVRQTILGQVLFLDQLERKTVVNVLAVHILGEHTPGRRRVDLNTQRAKQLAPLYDFACSAAMLDPTLLLGDFGFDDREEGANALVHPSLLDAWAALHPTDFEGESQPLDASTSGVTLDPRSNELAALTFADYLPGRVDRVLLRNHPDGVHQWKFCSAHLIDPHTPAGCVSDHNGLAVALSLQESSLTSDGERAELESPVAGTDAVGCKLIITVGPQCAGKSTELRKLRNCLDIAIDDFPGLYVPIPLESLPRDHQARILRDAVYADTFEPDVFVNALERTVHKKAFSPKNRKILLDSTLNAVLNVRKENHIESFRASTTYDKLEFSMFKKAIPGTLRRLEDALKSGTTVVAWGNTNSKLSDMYTAITLAEKYAYDVEFLVLPEVALEELLRRNICRFLQTGKYVPVEVIFRTKKNVQVMLATPLTVQRVKKDGRRR